VRWKVCCGTRTLLVVVSAHTSANDDQLLGASESRPAVSRRQAGKTLRLHYVRSWEKGVVPARTFTLRVTVVYH
jgi:hypothetical protein